MSEFLRNLAARSLGSLETIRPRVPSRFEPIREANGLLAGRTLPKEEGLEDNPEAEPTRPTGLSPRLPIPSPADSVPEPLPTQAAARPTARASSPMTPPSPDEPVLQAKRNPRSENAGSLTPARRTVTETVTSRVQNAGNVSELEPAEAGTGQAVESAIAQSRETSEGAIQNRTEQDARTGRQTRSAQALGTSNANAPDSGLIVSPKTPALPEQMNERSARAPFIASSGSEIEPRMLSSRATERAHSDEAATGQSHRDGRCR